MRVFNRYGLKAEDKFCVFSVHDNKSDLNLNLDLNIHSQKFSAAEPLSSGNVDIQWGVLGGVSSEVGNNLVSFLHVEQ